MTKLGTLHTMRKNIVFPVDDPGSTEYLMENMENKSSIEENTEDLHDFTCLK